MAAWLSGLRRCIFSSGVRGSGIESWPRHLFIYQTYNPKLWLRFLAIPSTAAPIFLVGCNLETNTEGLLKPFFELCIHFVKFDRTFYYKCQLIRKIGSKAAWPSGLRRLIILGRMGLQDQIPILFFNFLNSV